MTVEGEIDARVRLTLVAAQVQHLEGAEIFVRRLQLTLHADQALARGVDPELAEVRGDPLAAQFLRYRRRSAGAAEEIGDQIAFVAAGLDNAFEQSFGFLGGVADVLWVCAKDMVNLPNIPHGCASGVFVQNFFRGLSSHLFPTEPF